MHVLLKLNTLKFNQLTNVIHM